MVISLESSNSRHGPADTRIAKYDDNIDSDKGVTGAAPVEIKRACKG
jgi:hypothetical protein